ncbi:MAG: hypothetical protein NDJ92_13350, partial [Thermoanaerobaculia bacterium]|nr:hypothetical protein [Thermoanaerobaculia bacterium]
GSSAEAKAAHRDRVTERRSDRTSMKDLRREIVRERVPAPGYEPVSGSDNQSEDKRSLRLTAETHPP